MKKLIITNLGILSLILSACTSPEKDNCNVDNNCIVSTQHKLPNYDNSYYYTNGKFDESKAKKAVIELMDFYNYPKPKDVEAKLWVSDYGTGQFTKVGLAAISYANEIDDAYMLQDLFLLPNQMLPEHWHVAPKTKVPVKMEGWLIKNGKSYVVGIGENNLKDFPQIKIPQVHSNGKVTVFNVTERGQGEFAKLQKAESHHWQMASDKGAIIAEVANNHVNECVRHYDDKINKHFLGE